jgi:hypothetical protein
MKEPLNHLEEKIDTRLHNMGSIKLLLINTGNQLQYPGYNKTT